MDNLVMMCEECNKAKGSKVVPVNIGARYVKQPYHNQLCTYFDNYIDKYDYVSRGNILACDYYQIIMVPEAVQSARLNFKKKINMPLHNISVILKRAYPEDQERLTSYFTKYLKKYEALGSEKAPSDNIKFWMRFGCIYFIERNGDIEVMCTVLVNKHGYISMNLFPYYSNKQAYSMSHGIVSSIGDAVVEENNLDFVPVSVNMLVADNLTRHIIDLSDDSLLDINSGELTYCSKDATMVCCPYYIYSDSFPKDLKVEDDVENRYGKGNEKVKKFLSHFSPIEANMKAFLQWEDMMDSSWMADEVTGRDLFNVNIADAEDKN